MSWAAALGLPDALDWQGRCFACGGFCEEGAAGCPWCGVRFLVPFEGRQAEWAGELAELLRTRANDWPADEWMADDITLRQLATAAQLIFEPDNKAHPEGHSDASARGRFTEGEAAREQPVSVVILSRPGDPQLPRVAEHARSFSDDVVVILDTDDDPDAGLSGVRVLTRRIGGNFAEQRNAAQAAAQHPWVLHLDTDEEISRGAKAALPLLLTLAERDGLSAIGFPRRNYVDDQLTAHYPDVQYRLVRREQRFEGAVHERPEACRVWQRTLIAFGPGIAHRQSRQHILARRERYDGMGQTEERRAEAELLLTPWPRG